MTDQTKVEICIESLHGAQTAREAGADRVEMCAGLAATGGLTPTPAAVALACETGIEVHVLIRCRPGGFVYSATEVFLMKRQIAELAETGATGVVIGCAKKDNTLDLAATEQLSKLAHQMGMDVTLHRVIDIVPDRERAIRDAAKLGMVRILTSAGHEKATDCPADLAVMVGTAHPLGVQIMAGGGITPSTVDVLKKTGVAAVHSSCSKPFLGTGPVGPGGGATTGAIMTDEATVSELVSRVASW